MRAWWALVVLSGCAHVASTPRAPEQWSDEPPAAAVPVEATPEPPRVGPVVGVHIGASVGRTGPDLGGRLGARFRVARHVDVSLYADVQVAESRVIRFCTTLSCAPRVDPYTVAIATAVARVSVVSDGHIGPFFVPTLTLGAFVGGGVGWDSGAPGFPATSGGGMRAGLHLGMTRLPNGWWFPVFLEAGVLGLPFVAHAFTFVFGVGL